eukprot:92606-Chlamydomonas_euryale.AAC.1
MAWRVFGVRTGRAGERGGCSAVSITGRVRLTQVTEVYEPTSDGSADRCFISKGYDPTTHFETTVDDCLDMYRRITGKELDLTTKEGTVEA